MLFSILSCRETLDKLDDYLDRELSPRDIVLVERHLKLCRKCADRFKNEAEFQHDLREKLQHIEVPAGLLEKLMGELPAEPVTLDS